MRESCTHRWREPDGEALRCEPRGHSPLAAAHYPHEHCQPVWLSVVPSSVLHTHQAIAPFLSFQGMSVSALADPAYHEAAFKFIASGIGPIAEQVGHNSKLYQLTTVECCNTHGFAGRTRWA